MRCRKRVLFCSEPILSVIVWKALLDIHIHTRLCRSTQSCVIQTMLHHPTNVSLCAAPRNIEEHHATLCGLHHALHGQDALVCRDHSPIPWHEDSPPMNVCKKFGIVGVGKSVIGDMCTVVKPDSGGGEVGRWVGGWGQSGCQHLAHFLVLMLESRQTTHWRLLIHASDDACSPCSLNVFTRRVDGCLKGIRWHLLDAMLLAGRKGCRGK